jgi:ketosteroid isomerase-like protein
MENVFKHVAADWEEFGATPDVILAAGDAWVAAMGRYHGRYKPTGKTLDCDFSHFFQLRDGKVIKFHQYTDSALWNEVMS